MPMLTVNGVGFPGAADSLETSLREVGATADAFDGSTRKVRLAIRRDLAVRTVPLARSEAFAWEGLINGLGESWSFDAHLYGSKGTPPISAAGVTLTSSSKKFGTSSAVIAAAGSLVVPIYAPHTALFWSAAPTAPVPPAGHEVDGSTVSLWRLDEGFGNAPDTAGTTTLSPHSGSNVESMPGQIGSARMFPGSGGGLEAVGTAALGTVLQGPWSFEAWLWLDPSWSSQALVFSYIGQNFTSNYAHTILAAIGIKADRKPFANTYSSNTSGAHNPFTGGTALPTGEWVHFAVTRESAGGTSWTYRAYVNGVAWGAPLVGLGGLATPITGGSSHLLSLGSGANGVGSSTWETFRGYIDDVRFSSVTRSPTQIAASYARGVGAPGGVVGPFEHWAVRSDGARFLNGVATVSAAPATASNGALTIAAVGASRWVDDLVVLPYEVPDAWLPQLAAAGRAFSALPRLTLAGDAVQEATTRTVHGSTGSASWARAYVGGALSSMVTLGAEFLEG